MKKMKNTFFTALLLCLCFCGSFCTGRQQKSTDGRTTEPASQALEVDGLLTRAETLSGKEVVVEGICTHACKHGATKIFLMGSDDRQVIRVEAGPLGSFDTRCINNIVRVEGTLREQRIDETYLQKWEARLKASGNEKHGEGSNGCGTEKKARAETADTPEGRIADFRSKIAQREAENGKAYLSFYYIEASGYEIR